MIDVVRAEDGADELLKNEVLLVGATRRRQASDRFLAAGFLDFLQPTRRVTDGFRPFDFYQFAILADHRGRESIPSCGEVLPKTAFDAKLAVVGDRFGARHLDHRLGASPPVRKGLSGRHVKLTAHTAIGARCLGNLLNILLADTLAGTVELLGGDRTDRTNLGAFTASITLGITPFLVSRPHGRVDTSAG